MTRFDKTLTPLLELARALAPANARLERELKQAALDPNELVRWRTLVEGLERVRRALIIDWKQEPADALVQLKRLTKAPAALKRAALEDEDLDTGQFLESLGRLLRETSTATLASIDTMSDSYALILLPTKNVKTLQALARRAGGAIDLFTGAALKSFTRARKKRESNDDELWYREQPHFIRGAGRDSEVAHFALGPLAFRLQSHLMIEDCKQVVARTFATTSKRNAGLKTAMEHLTRDGWRRVRRAEYIAAFQRARKLGSL